MFFVDFWATMHKPITVILKVEQKKTSFVCKQATIVDPWVLKFNGTRKTVSPVGLSVSKILKMKMIFLRKCKNSSNSCYLQPTSSYAHHKWEASFQKWFSVQSGWAKDHQSDLDHPKVSWTLAKSTWAQSQNWSRSGPIHWKPFVGDS